MQGVCLGAFQVSTPLRGFPAAVSESEFFKEVFPYFKFMELARREPLGVAPLGLPDLWRLRRRFHLQDRRKIQRKLRGAYW